MSTLQPPARRGPILVTVGIIVLLLFAIAVLVYFGVSHMAQAIPA